MDNKLLELLPNSFNTQELISIWNEASNNEKLPQCDIIRLIFDPIINDTLNITNNNEIKIEATPSTLGCVTLSISNNDQNSNKEIDIALIVHYRLAFHMYFMKCKPNEKKKRNISLIHFKTKDSDQITKTKISLNVLSENHKSTTRSFNLELWTPSMDNEVMELFENSFNINISKKSVSIWNEANGNNEHKVPKYIEPFSLKPDQNTIEELQLKSGIQHFDILQLKTRYLMLRMLNYKMENTFLSVDFGQVGLEWSLAAQSCRLRLLIVNDLKKTSNGFIKIDVTNVIQIGTEEAMTDMIDETLVQCCKYDIEAVGVKDYKIHSLQAKSDSGVYMSSNNTIAYYNGYINNISYIPSVKNHDDVFTCAKNHHAYKSQFGLIILTKTFICNVFDEKSISSNAIFSGYNDTQVNCNQHTLFLTIRNIAIYM